MTTALPTAALSSPARAGAASAIGRTETQRTVVCIRSDELFSGQREVQIEHRGAFYRLQQTSLGKLILTK